MALRRKPREAASKHRSDGSRSSPSAAARLSKEAVRRHGRVAADVTTGRHSPGCGQQAGALELPGLGRPCAARPALLLTVGALEGIFRPLEIGRHLGGTLSSPGVSELPSGLDRERRRRGTSASFHAPRQQSPAPSRPETERKETRDSLAAAAPPPEPRM